MMFSPRGAIGRWRTIAVCDVGAAFDDGKSAGRARLPNQ